MANSFFGGLLGSIGPAIQQGQESALKRKMLEMQMQEYQAKQQLAQAKQQLATEYDEAVASGDQARVQAVTRKGAMLGGDFGALLKGQGQTVGQMLEDVSRYEKQGSAGAGKSPYESGRDVDFSFGPSGPTVKLNTYRPAGKLGEVGAYLQSIGADPYDKNAQIAAMQAFSATGEAQANLLSSLAQQYGGRGGQQQGPVPQQIPQQQEEGIEAVGPDGKPMYFDQRSTYDEALQRGIIPPQGGSPYQPLSGGGGSPYDVIRQKEVAAAIQQAGGTERARTLNEGLSKEERASVGTTQSLGNLVRDVEKMWKPGYTGVESIGATIREKTGNMDRGESNWRTLYTNLKRIDVRSSAGLSQTATELQTAIAAVGEPGLSDKVFRERIGTVRSILKQAQDIDDALLTAPRGEVPGILQRQRQGREPYSSTSDRGRQQAGPQAGGVAPDGTVIRMKDGSSRVKQGGKWAPYRGN